MKYDLEDQNTEVIMSPSSRRAWIEIGWYQYDYMTWNGRPPRGGRGLKSLKPLEPLPLSIVALLAEGVD